ncbi:MAG: hypothetical protein NXI27_29930 [Alphaproteobacteria bacterium]|nr:hypothetical protein [Alphaproteobacteria bacterium]
MTNDVFNVQRGITGRGSGDDTYIISPELVEENAEIIITDAFGANTIQLIGGVEVAASQTAANAVQLTLSNGAVITVLGASNYSFALGGDPLTGVAPASVASFTDFAALLDSTPAFTVNKNTFSADELNAAVDAEAQETVDEVNDTIGSDFTIDTPSAEMIEAVQLSDNAQVLLDAITAVDATATTVQQVADNATTAALTDADGEVYDDVDAAIVSNDAQVLLDAITAVDATAETVQDVADNATTAALTDADGEVYDDVDAAITSNDDAATDANVAAQTDFSTLAELVTAYDALANPEGGTFGLTTDANTVIGQGAGDVITGTQTTYTSDDIIVDAGTNDSDTLTINATADVTNTPTVFGIENLNYTLQAFGAAGGGDGATVFEVDVANVRSGTVTLDVDQVGSSIASAAVENIATGMTIVGSDDFTNLDISAADNADVSVQLLGSDVDLDDTTTTDNGGTAIDDLSITASGDVNVDTENDGALTITAAGDITIADADAAAGVVTATSTAGSVTVTTADATDTLILTATDEVVVTGATAATTVTVSAAGTGVTGSGTTASTVTATAMTTLSVSGNSAALYVDASESDLLGAVVATGEQNVTVEVDGDELKDITDFSFTDNTTAGTTTLNIAAVAGGTVDLVDAGADIIRLSADMNADDLDMATGATVDINSDQTALNFDGVFLTRATNELNLSIAEDGDDTDSYSVTALDVDAIATVNLSVAEASDDGTGGDTNGVTEVTTVDVGTGTLNVTSGSASLDLNSVTAGAFNASGYAGVIDIALVGVATVANVTTGSGADIITQTTADLTTGGYTINAGAGDDSITLLESADSSVDGGDDNDTVVLDGDYTQEAITLTSVETLDVDTDSTATNMRVDSSMLSGGTFIVTDSSDGDDDVAIIADEATTNLSGLTVDSATVGAFVYDGSTLGSVFGMSFTGSSISDEVTTGANADVITTGEGDDTVVDAGAGADIITLGAGDDVVTDAGTGADVIDGGTGNDTIEGGAGGDIITTGAGDDTIVIASGNSVESDFDSIRDFESSAASDFDTIQLDDTSDDAGTADAGVVLQIHGDIAAGAGTRDVSGADSDLVATDIDAVVTNGVMTLEGDDAAAIDTLAEWIDAAMLALNAEEDADSSAPLGSDAADVVEYAIAFEFDNNTYVVTAQDTDASADTALVQDDIVELAGISGFELATAQAAATIVIA